jgi:IPT/TIG domain
MSGSYELRDLDHAYVGQLYEGKLVTDKTYGHAAYGCGSCCGYDAVVLDPDPFGGPPGIDNDDYIYANDTCAGDQEDVTGDGYDWASSDTTIATLPNRTLHTVAVGSATGSTLVQLQRANPPHCGLTVFGPTQPVSVQKPTITSFDPNPIMIGVSNTTLTINGSGFGTDPTVHLPSGITSTGQGSTNSQIVLQGVSVALSTTVGNDNVTVTAGSQTSAPAALTVDGPYHMIVQSDITKACSGCTTTVERDVTYQIQNFSGSNAGTTPMCETPTFSGWNCTQGESHRYDACSSPVATNSGGVFTDTWSMSSDAYTPAGCGFNIVDHWDWASHSPVQDLGTLTGFVHTNTVSINGVVSPNKIPAGTVIPF